VDGVMIERPPTQDDEPQTEALPIWRCPRCGQRIGDGKLGPGSIVVIKCSKCNYTVTRTA